jgi:hypothetical protein
MVWVWVGYLSAGGCVFSGCGGGTVVHGAGGAAAVEPVLECVYVY